MKIDKFISKLNKYIDLDIDDAIVNDIVEKLKNVPNHIFDVTNFDKWIPNWQNMEFIKFAFTYQVYLGCTYMNVKTKTKDGVICNDYEDLEFTGPLFDRLRNQIRDISDYKKAYIRDCFSKKLLNKFNNLKIKLVIGNCKEGYDT